ncbi:MAG: hydantoinase/oxoprolinase family protein [Rhodospirillaceae bacterium]|nr:hydantoinase/oxoprolinase family protein [Rhodospirillaceae bacterium]MDD9917018.1 hydantoinase/oxoprolinase family protein [Rhodospirillaceae bacterium]MDD9927422.1 hydantoinase/oxoprolinase family protein [Rhodospirillaceae bacterium]
MTGTWQVGIDVGGTFTDVVALRPDTGDFRTAKVQSRAAEPADGLHAALAAVGLNWTEVADLIHGTTLITNAIVEGHLSKVALITTAGFGDSLAIGRQNRRYLYRLDLPPKATPQVPDERRIELSERLDADGSILTAPTDEALADAIAQATACDAEAIAVSLLHAYANPAHEELMGAALRNSEYPVALSHRVNPEAREYERTATTVLSASVMPRAAAYLEKLETATPDGSRLHLFHSSGGMAAPAALRELPLGLALSGPAAGVAAASKIAADLGIENAISLDMGGTTTDVCLIAAGRAEISVNRSLGDHPLRQPMVAIESIGAGGGSIARLNMGAVEVGPDSAGAVPGPACYGQGGTDATVTDANLVLGYLEPGQQLGESIRLDPAAAQTALQPVAAAAGVSVTEAAYGIVRVANATMVRALNRVTVERGIDGRACDLLAFGGAGPMHAVALARAFGIRRVIVPAASSVFSAVGCVTAEMQYTQQQTVRMASEDWDAKRLALLQAETTARLSAPLRDAGHRADQIKTEFVASIRYSGQSYATEITNPALEDPQSLGRQFREIHHRLYGFATEEAWELYALRCTVSLPREVAVDTRTPHRDPAQPSTSAPCWFGGRDPVDTPRYDRTAVAPGQGIAGPAIIEDSWSTTVVPPGAAATVDPQGHLLIDVGEAS